VAETPINPSGRGRITPSRGSSPSSGGIVGKLVNWIRGKIQGRPQKPQRETAPFLEGAPRHADYPKVDPFRDIPEGWVSVHSSNISALRYDRALKAIDVQYWHGPVWRYFNISPDEARRLFRRSHGIANWDIIRIRGPGNQHRHKKPAVQLKKSDIYPNC
jgi:hypothetical protein